MFVMVPATGEAKPYTPVPTSEPTSRVTYVPRPTMLMPVTVRAPS